MGWAKSSILITKCHLYGEICHLALVCSVLFYRVLLLHFLFILHFLSFCEGTSSLTLLKVFIYYFTSNMYLFVFVNKRSITLIIAMVIELGVVVVIAMLAAWCEIVNSIFFPLWLLFFMSVVLIWNMSIIFCSRL